MQVKRPLNAPSVSGRRKCVCLLDSVHKRRCVLDKKCAESLCSHCGKRSRRNCGSRFIPCARYCGGASRMVHVFSWLHLRTSPSYLNFSGWMPHHRPCPKSISRAQPHFILMEAQHNIPTLTGRTLRINDQRVRVRFIRSRSRSQRSLWPSYLLLNLRGWPLHAVSPHLAPTGWSSLTYHAVLRLLTMDFQSHRDTPSSNRINKTPMVIIRLC